MSNLYGVNQNLYINAIRMKRLRPHLTIFLLFAFFNAAHAQISKKEKSVLIDLYEYTNGDSWANSWNLDAPAANWYGVKIENNHVVGIELPKNNLHGSIPHTLKNLEKLEVLNLAFNKITGLLPSTLTQLENLKSLKLEMNDIKGDLSWDFSNWSKLEELTLFNNFLDGQLSETIGLAKNLKMLNLSSNNFSGNLPKSIENLSKLESLGLLGNKFEGEIQIDFANMANLFELVLSHNNFEGEFPNGIEGLAKLKFVQLQGNKFDTSKGLENLQSKELIAFDSDNDRLDRKYSKLSLNRTRMADTKLEDHE